MNYSLELCYQWQVWPVRCEDLVGKEKACGASQCQLMGRGEDGSVDSEEPQLQVTLAERWSSLSLHRADIIGRETKPLTSVRSLSISG